MWLEWDDCTDIFFRDSGYLFLLWLQESNLFFNRSGFSLSCWLSGSIWFLCLMIYRRTIIRETPKQSSIHVSQMTQTYIYIYIYVCVCETIPPRSPEYVNFFKPFHFLAGDQLVVPIGVSHISSWLQEIQSREWEERTKNKRTIWAWVNSKCKKRSYVTLHSLGICRQTLA